MKNDAGGQHSTNIAVIIPVWNGMRDLPSCLTALGKQQDVTFDVFAVDNGSTDGSAEYIHDKWPSVHLIHNDANLGFARACNMALREAGDCSAMVLLHQDTAVVPDWLAQLVAPLRFNPAIGIAGSKAYYPNGAIEHAGGRLDKRGMARHVGRRDPDRGQFSKPRKVPFVSGTALAISRQALETVGLLDEGFSPAWYEDVDWCYRVRRAGFHVVFAPKSRLVHQANSTLPGHGDNAPLILHRNRLRFVLIHWSLDRLVDDFMPAEQHWLSGLGSDTDQAMAVMRRAYLHQLVHLSELVEAREAAFANAGAEVDGMAAVLLALRSVYPLQRPKKDGTNTPPEPASDIARTSTRPFAWALNSFRRRFPRTSQAVLATPITQPLVQFTNQQQVADVLAEYMRENNRDIADLAQETLRHTQDAGN